MLVLDQVTCLLVTAMRLWKDGRRNWHLISREFRAVMGGEKGTRALRHFEEMMGGIALNAVRPLNITSPGNTRFTPDELMIVRALSAIQRDEFDIFSMVVEGLFETDHRSESAMDMIALARLLTRCDILIGSVDPQNPVQASEPGLIAAE